jgi:hypothetical protein
LPGPYPITPVLSDPNNRLPNYGTTIVNGTLTVVPAPIVSLSTTGIAFGEQNLFSVSSKMPLVVSNVGTADLSLASVSPGGANAGDFALSNGCGTTLSAGGNCTVNFTFTPLALTNRVATITLADNNGGYAGSQQTVSLSGSGVLTYALYATAGSCGAVTLGNSAYTDSFDSSQGSYVSTKTNAQGDIAVNGNATLSDGATVNGIIHTPTPSAGKCSNGSPGVTVSGKAQATGGYLLLSSPIAFTTPGLVTPGTSDIQVTTNTALAPGNYRDMVVSGNSTLTLSPGTYNVNSFTLSDQATVTIFPSGPVIINLAGVNNTKPFNLSGGSTANPAGSPSNLLIIYRGTGAISLADQSIFDGIVYAPNGAVKTSGQAGWFGALVVKTAIDSDGTGIHYDRSLGH